MVCHQPNAPITFFPGSRRPELVPGWARENRGHPPCPGPPTGLRKKVPGFFLERLYPVEDLHKGLAFALLGVRQKIAGNFLVTGISPPPPAVFVGFKTSALCQKRPVLGPPPAGRPLKYFRGPPGVFFNWPFPRGTPNPFFSNPCPENPGKCPPFGAKPKETTNPRAFFGRKRTGPFPPRAPLFPPKPPNPPPQTTPPYML